MFGGGYGLDPEAPDQEFITWPKFPDLPSSMTDTTIGNVAAVIPPDDPTTIDFVDGDVKRPSYENDSTSRPLAGLDAEFIRSLDIYADASVRVHVPDDEGQSGVGLWHDEFRAMQFRDVRVKQLNIVADEPALVVIVASTAKDMGIRTDAGALGKQRVATDVLNNDTRQVNYDDSWRSVQWVPEAVTVENKAQSVNTIFMEVPEGSSPTLQVSNLGSNNLGISAQVGNFKYSWETLGDIGYAPLPGWTRDGPKIVESNEDRILELGSAFNETDMNVNFVTLDAKQIEVNNDDTRARMTFKADPS